MKIGIWGLYDKGNFGDDLMAAMFFNYLKQIGATPLVYNASTYLVNELSTESITNLNEFVSNVDIVIIGGGGMLVNNSLPKILLRKLNFEFEKSFYDLRKALKRFNKKLIPLSIGGANSSFLNNPFKKDLFNSHYSPLGTVRLPSDLNLVSKKFKYNPDVVLSTSSFFPGKPKSESKRKKVLLNLKEKNAHTLIAEFERRDFFNKFEIQSFSSHAISENKFGSYEYQLLNKSSSFDTIQEACSIISDADIIISSKLHVGVAGLAYNVPFLSYCGPQKAKEFLKDYGRTEWIFDDSIAICDKLETFGTNGFTEVFNDEYQKQSFHHFEILKQYMNNNESFINS